jgi:hypothetical protein
MSREKSGGLSITTILLASAGAATASIVVPLVWEGGGVVAAAITPIIVALTSETLKRPVQKVQTVGVWRRTPQGTAVRQVGGGGYESQDPEEEYLEVDPEQKDDPFGLREPERRTIFTRRRVVLALTTAAIAFAIAAVVVTASELAIFGDSVSRPHRTTFFGGTPAHKADATPTPTPTATPSGSATPTPTPSATPSAAPSGTPTPAGGTPAPNSATPAPTVTPPAVPTP